MRRRTRWLVAAVVVALGVCAPTGASAQERCVLEVDGRSVLDAVTPSDPIAIDLDALTEVAGAGPAGRLLVELRYGPVSRTVMDVDVDGGRFSESVVVGEEIGGLGVGLYELRYETPSCSGTIWVDVGGRSVTSTAVGLAAVAAVATGGLLVALGLVRALGGRGARKIDVLGAIPLGIGLNVLAQQAGLRPVTTQSLLTFGVGSPVGTAVLQRTLAVASRALRSGPAPSPTSASLPTSTAPPPSAPAAAGPAPVAPPPTGAATAAPTPPAPAGVTATREATEPVTARFLQAAVSDLEDRRGVVPVTTALRPGARHRVEAWIGPLVESALHGTAPFPDEALPDEAEHELTVVLTEPTCVPEPLVATVVLGRTGSSGRACFEITTPTKPTLLTARLTVLHANRVLQTALLRARVVADPDPSDAIELVTEALVRTDLADLGSRDAFDAAVVVDRTAAGTPTLTTVRGGAAQLLSLDGTEALVQRISDRLTELAADPEAPVDLAAEGTVALLRYLAVQGSLLRDKLLEAQLVDHGVLDQARLQVLSVHPETYLPFEFLYDKAPPAKDAVLCSNAAQALVDGACADSCSDAATSPAPVVCPVGFWCLNRVIERHAAVPQRVQDLRGRGDIALGNEPTASRNTIDVHGSAVFAFSERVDRRQPPPSQGVIDALAALTGGNAWVASSWEEWRTLVATHAPGLLVLLSHTVEDEELEQPGLEIAAGDRLVAAYLDESYVVAAGDATPPVVLLLGCETATSGIGFERFMTTFQQKGAGVVVGTLATVLGYQAAPVAAALAGAIAERADGTCGFGDLLLATRRRLLADGVVLALTLTAYGDADWRIAATRGGT